MERVGGTTGAVAVLDSLPVMDSNPESGNAPRRRGHKLRLPLKITTISWWDLIHTLGPILAASAAAIWLALHFVRPLPPHTLTMSGGPKGSSFEADAEKYRAFLAQKGIELRGHPVGGLHAESRSADRAALSCRYRAGTSGHHGNGAAGRQQQ